MKPVMIGGPARISGYALLDTERLFALAGNTGNLAFRYAVHNHLGHRTPIVGWPDASASRVESLGDIAVLASANHLGPHEDMQGRANVIAGLSIPVVTIGLGAQSGGVDVMPELPEGARRWIQLIAERRIDDAPNILVRGEFTRRVLESIGIKDGVEVLGCPSLFINPDPDLGQSIAERLNGRAHRIAIAAGNPNDRSGGSIEKDLIRLATATNGSYIVQSPLPFVKAARRDAGIDTEWMTQLSDFSGLDPDTPGGPVPPSTTVYFDVDAWLEDLRHHDLVVGARYHGTALALQAGVPALCIAHDSRTEELCQTTGVPYVKRGDLEGRGARSIRERLGGRKLGVADLASMIDFDPEAYDRNRRALARTYVDALHANGLDVSEWLVRLADVPDANGRDTGGDGPERKAGAGEPSSANGTHIPRIQIDNTTKYDRYAPAFQAVIRELGGKTPERILSFGCSTGEEPLTLAEKYFPSSTILGVDVAPECVDAAREKVRAYANRVHIEYSSREALDRWGPFDVAFVMSVLCRWPQTEKMTDISGVYPFKEFDASVAMLSDYVRPGGLLVIWNASFKFSDSSVFSGYEAVEVPELTTSGYVKKFGTDNVELEDQSYPLFLFRKYASTTPLRS